MKFDIAKIASSFGVTFLALAVASPVSAATDQDFDTAGGTPFIGENFPDLLVGTPPVVIDPDANSTGKYLRLLFEPISPMNTRNGVGFDLSDTGAFNHIIADFDFRITCVGIRDNQCADGFSFMLLDTAVHGTSGSTGPHPGEHGGLNLGGQIAVGFNTFLNDGNGPDAGTNNSLSMLVNNNFVAGSPTALPIDTFDLATGTFGVKGKFHHARIDLVLGPGTPNITVTLTNGISGLAITPFLNFDLSGVAGLGPFERRVAFGARCGAACADYNLDNINVQYLDLVVVPRIEKEITGGPDNDGDGEIDVAVEVGQAQTTDYDFTITYANPDGPDAIIVDTVPAEWVVGAIDGDDTGLPVTPDTPATLFDLEGGSVEVSKTGQSANSATRLEWTPDPTVDISDINVIAETRQNPGGGHMVPLFAPTSCGKLSLNDGAVAFELDEFGEILIDQAGNPVIVQIDDEDAVTDPLMLVAVKDLDGFGIVGDGSGDEDGDGMTDAVEALNFGTDPCVASVPPFPALFGVARVGPNSPSVLVLIEPLIVVSQIGAGIGFERISGMDFDPTTGTLYATGERSDGSNRRVFITVDPVTGVGTEVGPTGLESFSGILGTSGGTFPDISFRPSDSTLFGFSFPGEGIATIDLVTGSATQVDFATFNGELGFQANDGNGLAFSPSGTLFHAAGEEPTGRTCSGTPPLGGGGAPGCPDLLHTVDPATSIATIFKELLFPPAPAGVVDDRDPRTNAMDFDPNTGILFASIVYGFGGTASNFLGTIDLATGVVTLLGPTVRGLDALAVDPN